MVLHFGSNEYEQKFDLSGEDLSIYAARIIPGKQREKQPIVLCLFFTHEKGLVDYVLPAWAILLSGRECTPYHW
jgi:hypothetical protein